METWTGKRRVESAFKGRFADRVPFYLILGQCNAQLIGASIKEFLTDPKIFVKGQIAGYERYNPDIVVMMADLLMEAEAMGTELRFPEDSMPIPIKVFLEDKGKLDSLTLPDPTQDGRMPAYLEAVAEANKAINDSIVSGVIAGPWTIAMGLRGAEDLIKDAIRDPDFVHELMILCTQMSIRFGEALCHLNVGFSYSDAPASCSLISPKMYRTFIMPCHKRIVDNFQRRQVGVRLHICGYTDPILEDMVSTGATCISIDAPTDLAKAASVARGRTVLAGNVNTNLFFSGSRKEMRDAIKNCIDTAAQHSGFILASGCEVPGVAPPEKIDWFVEFVRELGKYKNAT